MRHFNALRWWTRWSRQPDLGHEVAAGQLGQHASVDLVRLGRQGCDAFGLDRVGDHHLPAQALKGVVDEAGPGH